MPISDRRLDAAARAVAKVEGWDTSGETESFVGQLDNPRIARWVAVAAAAIKARPHQPRPPSQVRRTTVAAERDLEVLGELDAALRNFAGIGQPERYATPLDCGGTNGSDHSYRLNKLARLGLVEVQRRGGHSRGSKWYRLTDAGRAALTMTEITDNDAKGA